MCFETLGTADRLKQYLNAAQNRVEKQPEMNGKMWVLMEMESFLFVFFARERGRCCSRGRWWWNERSVERSVRNDWEILEGFGGSGGFLLYFFEVCHIFKPPTWFFFKDSLEVSEYLPNFLSLVASNSVFIHTSLRILLEIILLPL